MNTQKRRNATENLTTKTQKIRKTLKTDQEMNKNLHYNLPYLPVEIITEIIKNLTNVNDIKNCMKLSKDVNNFIFRTPKIVSKFKFNLDFINEPIASFLFVNFKGRHIKSMTLAVDTKESESLRIILAKTPKLEELEVDNKDGHSKDFKPKCTCCGLDIEKHQDWIEHWTPNPDSVELSMLKSLTIDLKDLSSFLKSTKKIKSLEKLSIFISTSTDQDIMTEFILQQDNLKELSFTATTLGLGVKFPTRSIASEVKFKLKSLKIHSSREKIMNLEFDRFLVTQADSLEELTFDSSPSDRTLITIFYRFQKLKKFSHNTDQMSLMTRNIRIFARKLNVVTHYEDMNSSGLILNHVFHVMPEIKSLTCIYLNPSIGSFLSVNELDVNNLKISNLKHVRMDNLKVLSARKLMDIQSEELWMKFVESHANINNLTLKGLENVKNLPIILKNLKSFKNLKKFTFLHNPMQTNMNLSQIVPVGYEFYEILIDVNEKSVKVSTHVVARCRNILDILIENFKGFEFFEICVEGSSS